VRDDHGAAPAHRLVAAGMVEMPMGVDDEAHRVRIHGRDGRQDLVVQRRELIVDDDVAVLTVGEADIAARAEQDGDSRGDLLDLDLDLREVLLSRGGRSEQCEAGNGDTGSAHELSPSNVFNPARSARDNGAAADRWSVPSFGANRRSTQDGR
jgi:hypothetical protein